MNGSRPIRLGACALLVGLLVLVGGAGASADDTSSALPPPPTGVLPPPPGPGATQPAAPATPETPPRANQPGVPAAPTPARPVAGSQDVRARLIAQLGVQYEGELHYLEMLGWRFQSAPGTEGVQVLGGRPCQRDSLQASIRAGDLRVLISPSVTDEQLKNFGLTLPGISDSMPSLGAYNHRLRIATRRATEKLAAAADADRYIFPKLLILDSPWWRLSPPEPEWAERGKLWHPRSSPAAAIHAIYTKDGTAECYVGQLVALWASQYELMGHAWFDRAFTTEEIWLGRPHLIENLPFSWNNQEKDYHRRRSLYILPQRQHEDPGSVLAEIGHIALSGRCGIIQNERDEGFFCNENFVIVDATPRAAAQLRLKGGFKYVASQTVQALELHRSSQNMLAPGDEVFRKQQAVEEILSQPIFEEIKVYIHPFGVITLREIVEKKLRLKTSAIKIALYSTGRDYAFYKRFRIAWIQDWIRRRMAQRPDVVPTSGS